MWGQRKTSKRHRHLKVRTLTPGHLREDCPITMFSENKRLSSFVANGPIKFKVQLCNL